MIIGFLISFWAVITMRHMQTSLRPDIPTTTLVKSGPFRYTRNPIYLGFTGLYAGIACLANTLWPILLLPFLLVLMNRGVIAREEEYLTRKFGEPYIDYKTQVSRWF